ncbi:MAG: long-chain fatty acid--CoA ligase, partial [Alphaproteobacteria bacterium]|nr:long-chain fatty acid--CoA ligase [Alphaproteobacteria bacterium]
VSVNLTGLLGSSSLGGRLAELHGCSVMVDCADQLTAALALIELDGVARRIVLCPPDLQAVHVPAVAAAAEIDAVVSDQPASGRSPAGQERVVRCSATLTPARPQRRERHQTQWVLLTSGTTGMPKLVAHSLSSLAAPIKISEGPGDPVLWSTFYDIRRYGGLQIFLRAVIGGGSLVLSNAEESTGDFLKRAGACAVTHISGTPSHWRRALMSPLARSIRPRYVRLSGEIADQAILDQLRATYPQARVAHAFASTEAGVAFEVGDALAGFPASLIGQQGVDVELKVENDSLRIRSPRTASGYLGNGRRPLAEADGFVDTGDIVARRGERYYFAGRRDGTINVGGSKVHPEEVEAVINRHPDVYMSLVKARKNPITGSVVVADVVLNDSLNGVGSTAGAEALKAEIIQTCRDALAAYKVPAAIRLVSSLDVAASGKLARQ